MPEHLLISIDLSGAEWFVTGYLAQEPNMISVHTEKKDAHSRTGSLMTGGLPEELIKREDKLLGKVTDPAILRDRRELELPELAEAKASWLPSIMTIRQAGKKSNHGFNYDMRYGRFSMENLIPETDAKKMERQYKDIAYPGLRSRYYPSVQQELHGGEECADCGAFRYAFLLTGPLWEPLSNKPFERRSECGVCGAAKWNKRLPRLLRNCFGRQVRLLGGWGPDLYQQGYSFKPQSTVADSVIQGMCDFYEAKTNKPWLKGYVWNTTHDELTVQFPIEPDLTDLAMTILDLQELITPEICYPPHRFRLGTDVKIGFRYGDPSAEDKADGLILLEPKEQTLEATMLALEEALEKLNGGR